MVQDKGRQSLGAFAQLDPRPEIQDSWFPALTAAQHFHREHRIGDEARAAPGVERRSAAGGTQALPHVASSPSRVRTAWHHCASAEHSFS